MNNFEELICQSRIKEIYRGSSPLIGEKERLALTAMYWHQEHQEAVEAFQETGRNLLLAQEQVTGLIAQLEAAQKENGVVRNKYESMSTAYSSVTAELAKAEAALSAANEKLSKAVVLPDYRYPPDMHTKQYYETIGFNLGLDACKDAIKAAGFTVEGE